MNQSKPTQNDMDSAISLIALLDCLKQGFFPDDEDGGNEPFELDQEKECMKAIEQVLALYSKGNLSRVVYALEALIDPKNKIVNPDLDYLELHPDLKRTEAAESPST